MQERDAFDTVAEVYDAIRRSRLRNAPLHGGAPMRSFRRNRAISPRLLVS